MGDSIKSRIIARLLELAEPLRQGKELLGPAGYRVIERKRTLFLIEPVKPALHLVIGDEDVVGHQDSDNRGFTMRFPAMWKSMVSDARDAYRLSDGTAAYLQMAIEADGQLSQLANIINYIGELPFTDEALKPDGGTVVMYEVEYRRYRGDPTRSY